MVVGAKLVPHTNAEATALKLLAAGRLRVQPLEPKWHKPFWQACVRTLSMQNANANCTGTAKVALATSKTYE